MSDNNNQINDFIVAQYNQTWESLRTHLKLSWQIPAFTMVAIAALMTTAPTNIDSWIKNPTISGIAFLSLAFSVSVLFVHHRRNNIFVKKYGKVLRDMEDKYGIDIEAHHHDLSNQLTGFDKISSTSMLIYFLGIITIGAFIVSMYFFSLATNTLTVIQSWIPW